VRGFFRITFRIVVMLISLELLYLVGMQSFTVCVEGSQLNDTGFYRTGVMGMMITPLFLICGVYSFRNPSISAKAFVLAGILCLAVGTATSFKSLLLWGGVSFAGALFSFWVSKLKKKVKLRVIPGGKLKAKRLAG